MTMNRTDENDALESLVTQYHHNLAVMITTKDDSAANIKAELRYFANKVRRLPQADSAEDRDCPDCDDGSIGVLTCKTCNGTGKLPANNLLTSHILADDPADTPEAVQGIDWLEIERVKEFLAGHARYLDRGQRWS